MIDKILGAVLGFGIANHFVKEGLSEDYPEWEDDFARGGKLSKLHKQLKLGTTVEMEHKDTIEKFKKAGMKDVDVARMIAIDHLKEDPNYYTKLKEVEGK